MADDIDILATLKVYRSQNIPIKPDSDFMTEVIRYVAALERRIDDLERDKVYHPPYIDL